MSFTKSTTDISVHRSLSDNPNIDDGLTAEQLKATFDFPAETLQDNFNDHIDELEASTAAASVGAANLGEGDTTDDNIQAKLEYLLAVIQGVTQGAVADGSITEAKLDSTFNGILAKKNGNIQTGLNSEKLGGYTLAQVLAYVKPETGTYTGDGVSTGKEINLGFTPSAVIVISSEAATNYSSFGRFFGMAFSNVPYSNNNYIECIENGFRVKGTSSSSYSSPNFNKNNTIYGYIAFK